MSGGRSLAEDGHKKNKRLKASLHYSDVVYSTPGTTSSQMSPLQLHGSVHHPLLHCTDTLLALQSDSSGRKRGEKRQKRRRRLWNGRLDGGEITLAGADPAERNGDEGEGGGETGGWRMRACV